MAKPSQVVVLSEDQRHQTFVRRYLGRIGYSFHDIRFEELPSGRGCGEQWVRERYARSVAAYRARQVRAHTALVVAIDADSGNIDRRVQQLRSALISAELTPRSVDEKIAHLIPKRNIETWILCLHGKNVDEETDYRNAKDVVSLIGPAAEIFFSWTRENAQIPNHSIPSLIAAILEVKRLE